MRNYTENVIVKMTFEFALEIMEFSEILRDKKRFAFADQVLRSGCSIGANVKEAEETEYWLELCDFGKNYPKPGKLLIKIESILKVLNKIISSSKKSTGKTKINPLVN